jgi:hypothetical protein
MADNQDFEHQNNNNNNQTTAHKKLSATIDATPLVADRKWLLWKLGKTN